MDEAERCNRVALVDKGRVVDVDTPDNLKLHMRGELLELICSPQRRATEILATVPGVLSVEVFGERLHVWVEEAERDQQVVERELGRSDVKIEHIRRVAPSLEDVFVSVLTGAGA